MLQNAHPPLTFTYQEKETRFRGAGSFHLNEQWFLHTVDNGYGGQISYTYEGWVSNRNSSKVMFQVVDARGRDLDVLGGDR